MTTLLPTPIYKIDSRLSEVSKTESQIHKKILEVILRYSSDGILVTDFNGKAIAYSETYRSFLGASNEIIKDKTINDFYNEGWLSTPVVYKVVQTRQQYSDFISYYKTGKTILVTGIPVFSENNFLEYVVLAFKDLSEIKKLETELIEQKELVKKYKRHLFQSPKKSELTRNKEMQKIEDMIHNAAKHDSSIILFGETGVGKSMFAEKIHNLSKRFESGQFIKVNCANIPDNLLELELFGYEKGAFTDAKKEGKEGLVELADKGTLFLDEVGELNIHLQSKLLGVLEDKTVRRVGATKYKNVDIRIISATHRDLNEMVKTNMFRKDLFYRLNVFPIVIPPLRRRKEDIIPLLKHFEEIYSKKYNVIKPISPKVYQTLLHYEWPGNIRELMHVVERLLLIDEEIILNEIASEKPLNTLADMAENIQPDEYLSLKAFMEKMEKRYILSILDSSKTLKEAAQKMDIETSTLVRKKQKYNIYRSYR